MNKKRFVAVLAAATMLLSTVPVFAADATVVTDQATQGTTGVGVTGDATVNDFDKTPIYKVTLPTTNSLDFIVDPHGLVDLASGEAMDVDLTATGCGAVLPAADDAIAYIKNESSVDVVVKVTFSVNEDGATLVTDSAADADIAVATSQSIFLCAVPSATQAMDASDYVATGKAVAIYDDAELSFRLDKAKYEVKNDGNSFSYQIKVEEGVKNWDSTAFQIGGKVNKQGDWTTVDELSINAVFTFDQADAEVKGTEGLYAVVSGTAVLDYKPVVDPAQPLNFTLSGTNYTIDDTVSTFKFAAPNATVNNTTITEANKIATITVNGKPLTLTTHYTLNATSGVITITQANLIKALGVSSAAEIPAKLTVVIKTVDGTQYKGVYTK